MKQADIQRLDAISCRLHSMLNGQIPPLLKPADPPVDEIDQVATYLNHLIVNQTCLRDEALAISKGDLSARIASTLPMADGLKNLQAALRHLTWQARQISEGDFSQRIDFLGDFSQSFNRMVSRLSASQSALQAEIRERKLAEKNLKTAHSHLEFLVDQRTRELSKERDFSAHIINSMPGIFFLYQMEKGVFRLKRWNHHLETILGFSVRELSDTRPGDLVRDADIPRLNLALSRIMKDRSFKVELELKQKNGGFIPFYIQTRGFTEHRDRFLIGSGIDITEQRQAEKEKQRLQEQLNQALKMEAIGTLAGGIAHDFNNLLNMIMGNTELALDELPDRIPVRSRLENIHSAGSRAAGIVKQLLNFSRKTTPELKPISAVEVIRECVDFLRSTIPATIDFKRQLPDAPVTIMGDAIQLNQVVMNLCTNSFQAMEETGGTLEILAEKTDLSHTPGNRATHLPDGGLLKLVIRDTGPGISPEIMDRIFDPYFTTKDTGKGSGMGLSVVHGIIKSFHGAIFVDSLPGKGATFTLFFPIIQPVGDQAQGYLDEPGLKPLDQVMLGSGTILFIDDESIIVDMNRNILAKLGYEVDAYPDPVQALEVFRSDPGRFDLIITDYTMPRMTGAELAREILALRPDIPVIICTGDYGFTDAQSALEDGIAAVLTKPVPIRTLSETIQSVLDKASV